MHKSVTRLKHLFVTTGYPPRRGIFAHRMLLRLQDQLQTKVLLLTARPDLPRSYVVDGIPVKRVICPLTGARSANPIILRMVAMITWLQIKRELAGNDIWESGNLYPVSGFLTLWKSYSSGKGKIVVGNAIGDDVHLYLRQWHHRYPRRLDLLLRNHDAIFCRSRDLVKEIEEWAGFKSLRIEWAPRGVDATVFSPRGEMWAGLPGNEQTLRFLYLGGFPYRELSDPGSRDVKGGMLLLEAWKRVEERVRDVHLVIAGPGTRKKPLEEWINKLHHPDRIIILEGVLPPEKIPSLMRACHCCLIPSRDEGLPNILLEAQSSGLAVIASSAGGIPDAVRKDETALLFPPGDVVALVQKIIYLANNRSRVRSMGKAARSFILENFTWDIVIGRTKKIYKQLL